MFTPKGTHRDFIKINASISRGDRRAGRFPDFEWHYELTIRYPRSNISMARLEIHPNEQNFSLDDTIQKYKSEIIKLLLENETYQDKSHLFSACINAIDDWANVDEQKSGPLTYEIKATVYVPLSVQISDKLKEFAQL